MTMTTTTTANCAKVIPEGRRLAAANCLDELLEATGLGLRRPLARLARRHHGALLRHPLLRQVLGAVLELSLSRASRGGHISETPHPAGALARDGAGRAWPISLLAHLLDR